ncbi:MAG: phospholipase D family protein [Gammaproteobacteria bacterium]|nr:MAG: phospholipase D family protein [Gammaproteobacteria bacterium]
MRLLWPMLALLLAGLGGCATIDFDAPKEESYAPIETEATRLGRWVTEFSGERAGQSGFLLVPQPLNAMAFRLSGAGQAENTIDAMYYLINADKAGLLCINSLIEAAERGVRVRLLLDDILTGGYDRGLLALDAHPNIQIRMFNPFARRGGISRGLNFLGDFGRLNRRMHNKAMITDNQVAIIGGRNIGDEYFAAHEVANFGDMDVLALGPVVREISSMFDLYWNHRLAVPVNLVIEPPEEPFQEIAELRARIAVVLQGVDVARYERVVDEIRERERVHHDQLSWVPYDLVYDSPDKADKKLAAEAETMIPPLRDTIMAGEKELMIVSPYFVPRSTMDGFQQLRDRGMSVKIITNSMAANNHLVVHSGYAPSRKPLLKMGAEIYEVRADAKVQGVEKTGVARSGGTLHAKVFVVDREELFVGTFNWDPRSKNLNTEMGIILHAPELARPLAEAIMRVAPERAYRLRLDDRGKIEWVTQIDGEEVVFKKEPDSTWWQRFKVGFYRILPIKEQL